MKLLLSLLLLLFINYNNAQIVVNTTFTLAKCTNPYSSTFKIDQCLPYCGSSGSRIKFSYDFETEQYLATAYQDNWCDEQTKQFNVDCSELSFIDNTQSVLCSNLVSVLNFNNFTVTGSKCPSSGANIPFNKCTSSCDGKYSLVTKVQGEVNGYQLSFSDASDCKSGETKVYPVYCGSNNEQFITIEGYGVVCQNASATIPTASEEEGNSSTSVANLITFSSVLLLLSILLSTTL